MGSTIFYYPLGESSQTKGSHFFCGKLITSNGLGTSKTKDRKENILSLCQGLSEGAICRRRTISTESRPTRQVSMDMRNVRTEENKLLFSREEWLTRNQVQSYFSRLSALKRRQVSGPPCNQPGLVEIDDLIQEDDWFQQVGEVYKNLLAQHPIYYDTYNLRDLHKWKMISSFNAEMLKPLCKPFGITFKAKDRKQVLVDKLTLMLEGCSCTRSDQRRNKL